MSQHEVYQLLIRNKGKWLSAKEIAKKLNITHRNASVALLKISKYDNTLEVNQQCSINGGYKWRVI
jgi:hypothetical protein